MQIAQSLSGFSLADADSLRKAMGKKIAEVMQQQEAKFLDGAVANGVARPLAKHVWDQIVTFAGYGFNKSHSAAYAVITYRTAYLKAHYPVDYMAAQLTNEISGSNATESIARYMAVCRPMGIRILPPDINHSFAEFTVEGSDIRFGLEAIKNVGHAVATAISDERERAGPFRSLQDLCERVDTAKVNAKALECLIKSGAFDTVGLHRSQLLAMLPEVLEISSTLARERASGQESLFALDAAALEPARVAPPDIPEWPESERLAHEKELLGTYLSGHPLDRHAEPLAGVDLTATTDLGALTNGAKVDLLGLVRAIRPITTKKGDKMAFVTVEDYHGTAEVVVFSDAYERHRALLVIDRAIWIRGTWQVRDERRSVIVNEILDPAEAAKAAPRWITIDLPPLDGVNGGADRLLDHLAEILRQHPGRWRVRLAVPTPEGIAQLETPLSVTPGEDFDAAVRAAVAELESLAAAPPLTTG